jgi:glycosyltransferase involved in cell wall biosynthesis
VHNGVLVLRQLADVAANHAPFGWRSRLYQLRIGLANRRCARATNRVLDAFQPDAVVFWGMKSWLVAPVLSVANRGLPCLADLGDYWLGESLDMYVNGPRLQSWYRRRVMLGGVLSPRMFHEVWVHSSYMQERYGRFGIPLAKVNVIPRGLDAGMLQDGGRREHTTALPLKILCVGRLVPDKGGQSLAAAFSLLRKDIADVELHFYGDAWDWYRKDLEEDCRRYGLLDNGIYIHDRVDAARMNEIYAKHDILAFPVLWDEPSSNVLLEAMAFQLPIVATATGSNGEFVQDGITGFLVPAASPTALADRLRQLCEDARLRARMGIAARQFVLQRHQQGRVFDATEKRLCAYATAVPGNASASQEESL